MSLHINGDTGPLDEAPLPYAFGPSGETILFAGPAGERVAFTTETIQCIASTPEIGICLIVAGSASVRVKGGFTELSFALDQARQSLRYNRHVPPMGAKSQ
jgi:hypothetical protein